jgi:hypothetical protein
MTSVYIKAFLVVDVQTEPATVNRFGPVTRGNLILSGLLVPIKVDQQGPNNPFTKQNIFTAVD